MQSMAACKTIGLSTICKALVMRMCSLKDGHLAISDCTNTAMPLTLVQHLHMQQIICLDDLIHVMSESGYVQILERNAVDLSVGMSVSGRLRSRDTNLPNILCH